MDHKKQKKCRRGQKICPSCLIINGPRGFECKNPECNHVFIPGKTRKSNPKPKGIGKGRKECPSCKKLVGPRSYFCPKCNHEFKINHKKGTAPPVRIKRKRKKLVEDWTKLEAGSVIKVVKGTGDYYVSKETGEKIYMQDSGKYKVQYMDTNGIVVQGKNGRGYIYMGKPKKSKLLPSIQKQAPKLLLLRGVESI